MMRRRCRWVSSPEARQRRGRDRVFRAWLSAIADEAAARQSAVASLQSKQDEFAKSIGSLSSGLEAERREREAADDSSGCHWASLGTCDCPGGGVHPQDIQWDGAG